MRMARLSGRSASLAGRQFRMAKLQRRVPTQRSETHHLLAITEAIPSGGLFLGHGPMSHLSSLMMLWTAPLPAHRCHGCGRC